MSPASTMVLFDLFLQISKPLLIVSTIQMGFTSD